MFILDGGRLRDRGASPEVHVRLTDGLWKSDRLPAPENDGATPAEDTALEKELWPTKKSALSTSCWSTLRATTSGCL